MIDELPPLREVIRQHGLAAKKSLGQNFLLDLNLTARIARLSGPLEGSTVIEVGPGPGGLTRALLSEGAGTVIAIERDERCLPALEEISQYYPGRLQLLNQDALTVDYEALAADGGATHIVANLPYNIATKLLVDWLRSPQWPPFYQSMTLMFQREVAERICAPKGSKSYGRLAVLSQWRAKPHIELKLPARAFTPPPKVDSAVVKLTPTPPRGEACELKHLERVTEAAFGQRRKMLRSSLKQLTSDPASLLEQAQILPTQRAEQLDLLDFTRLAAAFGELKQQS